MNDNDKGDVPQKNEKQGEKLKDSTDPTGLVSNPLVVQNLGFTSGECI